MVNRMLLSEEARADIVKLYNAGLSMRRVADKVGCSYTTVHRTLLQNGVQPRQRGGPTPGRLVTAEERAQMVQLYGLGLSINKIVEKVGRAPSTVHKIVQDSGIEMRPRGGPKGKRNS